MVVPLSLPLPLSSEDVGSWKCCRLLRDLPCLRGGLNAAASEICWPNRCAVGWVGWRQQGDVTLTDADRECRAQTEIGRAQTEIGRPQTGIGRAQTEIGRPQTGIGRPQTGIGRPQTEIGRPQTEIGREWQGMGPPLRVRCGPGRIVSKLRMGRTPDRANCLYWGDSQETSGWAWKRMPASEARFARVNSP